MTRLCLEWIKGLSKEEQDSLKQQVLNNTQIVRQLDRILAHYEQAIYEEECKESSYDKDWTYLQAHRNGKKEILRKLKELTKHIKES